MGKGASVRRKVEASFKAVVKESQPSVAFFTRSPRNRMMVYILVPTVVKTEITA